MFNKTVEIDIFEAGTVGGRLATVKLGNVEFEAGGSVIHGRNKYMETFRKLLNLQRRPHTETGTMGIWNGKEFVFKGSNWNLYNLAKLVYRYGFQLYSLRKYVTAVLDDFAKIYDLQDRGIGFENLPDLIGAMNEKFVKLLEISMKDHLTNLGYRKKLIDELVEAVMVVNYGQDTDAQAFVSSISLAGAGSDLWAVKDGNKEVKFHSLALYYSLKK